ncbi:MAG TPA: aspartate-semialdehyde dehydrogenase [Vicinamibacterales bacterium]|jgi:aspartate-semialdehyde dehydrogenase|nr:aspartate-semialdehyde dehydrogenase [Vicinamibacterales bacterium]
MTSPIDVGILGATGVVGQQLASLLDGHPWFRLSWVAASERSAGRRYGDLPWRLPGLVPATAARLTVSPLDPDNAPVILFSALDAGVAGEAETAFARSGRIVVSNARNHRLDPLVPLVIPEVNAGHLSLLDAQRRERGWSGAIVTNPNCSTVFVAMVLAALDGFQPSRALVTTLQAVSGAGHPGVSALDILGNVIPFIPGEEEKIERETRKILGRLDNGGVADAAMVLSAQTTRVAVHDGHTALMSIALDRTPSIEEVADALARFRGDAEVSALPSAPAAPIVVATGHDRPQPRLDAWTSGGMAVTCGRLRRCPVLGYKLVALGHNAIRGAAGAALLNAELLVSRERRLRATQAEAVAWPAEARAMDPLPGTLSPV